MNRSISLALTFISIFFAYAKAAQREIRFVAVTTGGAPVIGEVMKRSGNEQPQHLVQLDAKGEKTIRDIRCTSGLQFNVKSRYPVYIGSGVWKDCEYGEIKFIFNEVAWSKDYFDAIAKVDGLALKGEGGEIQLTAMFARNAFDSGDYGKLAFGIAQLRQKLPASESGFLGFDIVEKDSLARSLGVKNGIDVKPNGQVLFTGYTIQKFNFLKSNNKLPDAGINTMEVKAFVAKKDFLNETDLVK